MVELENTGNPFATVVMAHLKAQETRGHQARHKEWKLYLTKRLYERGYQRQDVLNLFQFIDWVMALPAELEASFWQEVQQYQQEKQMQYVTTIERIGIQKGLDQGIQQGIQQGLREGFLSGIELGLELKFGSQELRLLPEISKIEDVDVLRAIQEGLKIVNTLAELRDIYQQDAPQLS